MLIQINGNQITSVRIGGVQSYFLFLAIQLLLLQGTESNIYINDIEMILTFWPTVVFQF